VPAVTTRHFFECSGEGQSSYAHIFWPLHPADRSPGNAGQFLLFAQSSSAPSGAAHTATLHLWGGERRGAALARALSERVCAAARATRVARASMPQVQGEARHDHKRLPQPPHARRLVCPACEAALYFVALLHGVGPPGPTAVAVLGREATTLDGLAVVALRERRGRRRRGAQAVPGGGATGTRGFVGAAMIAPQRPCSGGCPRQTQRSARDSPLCSRGSCWRRRSSEAGAILPGSSN
jgi:hypothetical protein